MVNVNFHTLNWKKSREQELEFNLKKLVIITCVRIDEMGSINEQLFIEAIERSWEKNLRTMAFLASQEPILPLGDLAPVSISINNK